MAGDQALLNCESQKLLIGQYVTVHSKNDKTFLDALKGATDEQLANLCELVDVSKDETKPKARKAILEAVKELADKSKKTKTQSPKKSKVTKPEKAPKSEKEDLFVISTKFLNMLPKMSREEHERTKQSIKEDGLHEPLLVDKETKILIDGHNRYTILKDLDIEITKDMVRYEEIPKEDQERRVYAANITRRHLNDLEKISLARKFMPEAVKQIREEAQSNQTKGAKKEEPKKEPVEQSRTRKKEADLYGVSEWSVRKMEFLENWAPYLLEKEQAKEKPDLEGLYNKVKIWHDKVKENKPLLKKVKEAKVALADAYEQLVDKETQKEASKKAPPKRSLLEKVQKIWEEKYDMDDFIFSDLDEFDMRIYKLINVERYK